MFSRQSTPGSTTFESKKLLLEEQELYPKTVNKIALLVARRPRHQQRFDDRTRKRIDRRVQKRLRRPFERELFRLPNLKTFARSNRYQMVLREFSQNLASEFRTKKPISRTNGPTMFKAWAILDGCDEALLSIIHIDIEKVPLQRSAKRIFRLRDSPPRSETSHGTLDKPFCRALYFLLCVE